MQIEIDFDVFKALTILRQSEDDTYNDVLRRLLSIADSFPATEDLQDLLKPAAQSAVSALLGEPFHSGVWMSNVFFPNGTKFRATYKGKTYRAEIRDDTWIDEHGFLRQSPSDAAGAVSGTKVNGWKFWYAKRPADDDWHRLDELRK